MSRCCIMQLCRTYGALLLFALPIRRVDILRRFLSSFQDFLPLPNVKILSLVRVSQEARFATSRGKFCYVPRKQKSPLGELCFLRNITLRYGKASPLYEVAFIIWLQICRPRAVLRKRSLSTFSTQPFLIQRATMVR